MLQRANLALILVLLLAVFALSLYFWNSQRDSQIAIDQLSAQVRDLQSRIDPGAPGVAGSPRQTSPGPTGQIAISGSIARPGIYALPGAGGLTVTQAVTAAGGSTLGNDVNILLIRADGERLERPFSKYLADKEPTFLKAGDHLHIGDAVD